MAIERVKKVGKIVGCLLFLGGLLASIDIARNFNQHSLFIAFAVAFQLAYSVVLYSLCSKHVRVMRGTVKRLRAVFGVGIVYALALGVAMSVRHYQNFGFTFVLPVTVIVFCALFASPFLWALLKLRGEASLPDDESSEHGVKS